MSFGQSSVQDKPSTLLQVAKFLTYLTGSYTAVASALLHGQTNLKNRKPLASFPVPHPAFRHFIVLLAVDKRLGVGLGMRLGNHCIGGTVHNYTST